MIDFLQLKAVIWDMDGVIVDSEPVHLKTWQDTFQYFHIPYDPNRLKRAFGMTSESVVEVMADVPLSHEKVKAIVNEKASRFQHVIAREAVIFPGVAAWLTSFRKNGIQQAVASSAREDNIRIVLEKLKIDRYFDAIVHSEGIPSKPAPAVFIKAAEMLEVNPLNALVIEDSIVGIQAAKAAGMRCVAVANTLPASQLDQADLVVENLSMLMTADLQRLFPA